MEGEDPGDLQKEEVMIKVEHIDVHGFEAAVRGMRNPMNSWGEVRQLSAPADTRE